jgi:nucleoside permease NupC
VTSVFRDRLNPDLARLGLKALFVGFVATLLNAAIAGIFLQ